VRALLEAFAGGVNEGLTRGARRRAHELALLRAPLVDYEAADALALRGLMAFALSSNWDVELARLRILTEDGEDALRAIDPRYLEGHVATSPPGAPARVAVDLLVRDVELLKERVGDAHGSNNWALSPARTATRRALLANDLHLEPTLPSHWYLGHLRAPGWAVAGAALAGTPAIVVGHNGHVAWGITAGMADDTDLFIEEVAPDGSGVRDGDDYVPCETRVETISVRGGAPITERVLVTPRGPIVGAALDVGPWAVSLSATWLQPRPVRGFLGAHRARTCEELRAEMRAWPGLSLNLVCADVSGSIAWQLIGDLPRRRLGHGLLPLPASDGRAGWEEEPVAFEEHPSLRDPPGGWIATANNAPRADAGGPFLGVDWEEGYRATRIAEALVARDDWDPDATAALQLDTLSLVWRDVRDAVLAAPVSGEDARAARALLERWDGRVDADSPAATVFELFVADLAGRAVEARAPRASTWALGRGASPLSSISPLALRHVGLLVRLLNERPEGWFERGWNDAIAASLARAALRAGTRRGNRTWGSLRPLVLRHPFGERKPLDRAFNIGPFPWGGDANTISQASASPLDPTGNPLFVASLRMIVDVGLWDDARFVLSGGQSGNPLSPHYADMLERWRGNEGVAMAWCEEAVAGAAVATLRLAPSPNAI
jgi:penicillin amidase